MEYYDLYYGWTPYVENLVRLSFYISVGLEDGGVSNLVYNYYRVNSISTFQDKGKIKEVQNKS